MLGPGALLLKPVPEFKEPYKNMTSQLVTLVWLRRDLRLHDHAALAKAFSYDEPVQPVFVFDTEVLARFTNPKDRRLSFIARALERLDAEFRKRGTRLMVFRGDARKLIPKLAEHMNAARIVAEEDYEPATLARDKAVAKATTLELVKDHLIFAPYEILKSDGSPFKIYSGYAKTWQMRFDTHATEPYDYRDKGRYADLKDKQVEHFPHLDASNPGKLLAAIGYQLVDEPHWHVDDAHQRLRSFAKEQLPGYAMHRDQLAGQTTSQFSPYLRFGLLSVREVFALAVKHRAQKWLSELIWREFYAMTLFHFPETVYEPGNKAYRGSLKWRRSGSDLAAWKDGLTGYPIVDAGMRQLRDLGWMHNRARLIAATFLCKDLQIDWREGEEHFAQYLMDYELASNTGNWQWVASTGVDSQPYFRIFNPVLQSKKFDPCGDFIRDYVAELEEVDNKAIHKPGADGFADYPSPIVDHDEAKHDAIAMFKFARK